MGELKFWHRNWQYLKNLILSTGGLDFAASDDEQESYTPRHRTAQSMRFREPFQETITGYAEKQRRNDASNCS